MAKCAAFVAVCSRIANLPLQFINDMVYLALADNGAIARTAHRAGGVFLPRQGLLRLPGTGSDGIRDFGYTESRREARLLSCLFRLCRADTNESKEGFCFDQV